MGTAFENRIYVLKNLKSDESLRFSHPLGNIEYKSNVSVSGKCFKNVCQINFRSSKVFLANTLRIVFLFVSE